MAEDKEKKRIRIKKYNLEHREEINTRARINYKKNAGKNKIKREKYREENAEQIKEYMNINREKYRDNKLKKIYGISVIEYNKRLKEQGGKCAICGKEVNKTKNKILNFNIDHDHGTGKIRGLLCHKCNAALPNFEENLKLDENFIQKVNDYLLENKETSAIIKTLISGNNSMVELLPSKQVVTDSNSVSRSSIVSP